MTLFSGKIEPFFKYFHVCCFDISIYVNKKQNLQKGIHIKDTSTEYAYVQFVSNVQKFRLEH